LTPLRILIISFLVNLLKSVCAGFMGQFEWISRKYKSKYIGEVNGEPVLGMITIKIY